MLSRNNLRKNFLREEKKYKFSFSQDCERIFWLLAKNSRHGCQNCNLRIFARFWGKTFFFKSEHDFNLLRTLRWKKWVFQSKSFFQGSTNKSSRFQRSISMKKDFSFEKVFFFCYHFWSFSDFFVFLQNCLVRYVKPPIFLQREINGKYNLEKLFPLNNFAFWAEKNLDFQQNRRQESRNRSLQVQKNIFRKFSESKNICMKVFGHWMESSDFPVKMFSQGCRRRISSVHWNTLRKWW